MSVLVRFDDVEDFLQELALDVHAIERGIIRLDLKTSCHDGIITWTLVATALLHFDRVMVIRLDALLGSEPIPETSEDARVSECKAKWLYHCELLDKGISELGLSIRHGVYESTT